MQVLPRKRMGLGLMAVAMLFLWNPDIAVFDLLPDVFGYVLLSLGMSSLAYLNHHFDESAKRFQRMIALSGARLVFVLVLFGLVNTNERPTTMLLGGFVFGVLELLTLIPAYKHLFEGFLNAGTLSEGGKSVVVLRMIAPLTNFFVVAKIVLNVLPEFAVLTEQEGVPRSLYDFVWLFRIAGFLISFVIGLVWLIAVLIYFIGMLRDKQYVQYLRDCYMRDIYPNKDLFVAKRYKLGSFFLFLGVLLTLDLPMDGVNLIPDVLSAICLIAGVVMLRHYLSVYKPRVLVLGAYGVVSMMETYWQYRYFKIERYSAEAALRGAEATEAYAVSCVLSVISAVMFVMAMASVLACLRDMIRDHTGYVTIHTDLQTSGKLDALHKQLLNGLIPVFIMVIVCAVGGIAYTLTLPFSGTGGEWYTVLSSIMWLIELFFGVVLVFLFIDRNGDVMEQINNRYLLSTPATQQKDAE